MKTEIKIKIFTEGSEKIGFGHLSRCAALYDEAIRQGFSAELFIQVSDYDFTTNSILSNRRYSVVNWQSKKCLQKIWIRMITILPTPIWQHLRFMRKYKKIIKAKRFSYSCTTEGAFTDSMRNLIRTRMDT